MNMRILVGMLALLAIAAAVPAEAQKRSHGLNMTSHGPIKSCADLEIDFRGRSTARAEEEKTVPKSAIATLEVPAMVNSGVQVWGWDRNEYSVVACKAAAAEDRAEAERLLRGVTVDVAGGRVSVRGPASEDWVVYLIVHAPQGASLDLNAENGPLGVTGVSGKIRARAVNGPLSFKECSGEIDAEVRNGPIHLEGSGGNVRLRAQNGPLHVELKGDRWTGGELEGRTHNGPLSLSVPENYVSAVRVDASEHSPVRCRAVQCRQALRTWEHPSRIEFGSGTPVVRLSTVNGPVEVK